MTNSTPSVTTHIDEAGDFATSGVIEKQVLLDQGHIALDIISTYLANEYWMYDDPDCQYWLSDFVVNFEHLPNELDSHLDADECDEDVINHISEMWSDAPDGAFWSHIKRGAMQHIVFKAQQIFEDARFANV